MCASARRCRSTRPTGDRSARERADLVTAVVGDRRARAVAHQAVAGRHRAEHVASRGNLAEISSYYRVVNRRVRHHGVTEIPPPLPVPLSSESARLAVIVL